MKRKVLKNIPKPDEEKLAIFYGKEGESAKKQPEMSTVDKKMSIVDKEVSTVDIISTMNKISIVLTEDMLRNKLKSLITHSQQSVYISLYEKSHKFGRMTTDWVGYSELAKALGLSLKTVQRAVDKLITAGLIKRVDIANTAQVKGSKYQVILPQGMSTVDKEMSTVVKEPKTDVEF